MKCAALPRLIFGARPLGQGTYTVLGLCMLGAQAAVTGLTDLEPETAVELLTPTTWSLAFALVMTWISAKRAVHAGRTPCIALFAFAPITNALLFAALALHAPEERAEGAAASRVRAYRAERLSRATLQLGVAGLVGVCASILVTNAAFCAAAQAWLGQAWLGRVNAPLNLADCLPELWPVACAFLAAGLMSRDGLARAPALASLFVAVLVASGSFGHVVEGLAQHEVLQGESPANSGFSLVLYFYPHCFMVALLLLGSVTQRDGRRRPGAGS